MEYGEQFQLTFFCHFDYSSFPFDSHECKIEYGDENYGVDDLKVNTSTIIYHAFKSKTSFGDSPIILDRNMPFPYEFHLESLQPFETVYDDAYSHSGVLIKLKRNSIGQLITGYYYPTTSFALLSMISYLINPEKVS